MGFAQEIWICTAHFVSGMRYSYSIKLDFEFEMIAANYVN